MSARSRIFRFWIIVSATVIALAGASTPLAADDGSIVGWGRMVVVPEGDLTDLVAVAGGREHSLGLKVDGSIVAWGYNQFGQTDVPAPNSGFVAVAGGGQHSLGLKVLVGGECFRDPQWLCDGDVDGDGHVNPVDSGLVQAAFGSTDDTDLCQYDADCNGVIDPTDSGIVQSLFGTCNEPRDVCP